MERLNSENDNKWDNSGIKAKNTIKKTLDKFWEQTPNNRNVPSSKRNYCFKSLKEVGENVDRITRRVRLDVEILCNDFRHNLQTRIDQMLRKHEQNLSESLKSTDRNIWNNVPELIPRFKVSPKIFEPARSRVIEEVKKQQENFIAGWKEKQDEYDRILQDIQNKIDQKLTDEYARDIVAIKLETYSISVNLKNYASILRTITLNVKSA
ncbi:hypothetical protein BC936DRAFT_143639 [Jimgerdemannia flammicorona]|uniref:Uncharacterized protein n=1 Tax=Jimgerdemannia flammicorona TaxID=994334 RepID=A0A433DDL4_9FUNG|nr:hypothetical protein BC936DRAFT_143639 [Jimgerdemannia flammicorona]